LHLFFTLNSIVFVARGKGVGKKIFRGGSKRNKKIAKKSEK